MRRRWLWFVVLAVAALLALTACGGDDEASPSGSGDTATSGDSGAERASVKLQLKWVTQAQFAGYYAAAEQGFYEEENLDVEILPGGPDITPEQVVAGGQAEFGINWLPSLLSSRDQGSDLVNIAQVFQRSAMLEITHKDSGITEIAGMKGKKVGVWCCGNQFELLAALRKNNIDPESTDDVTIVDQPFTMDLFLNKEVDAAAAMTYNELAQVLEQENPETGELYQLDDLNVISMEDAGTAMLEDGIFVRGDWIADEANQDVAERFLRASFRGWIYCRDNQEECLQIVLDNGPTLPEGHQRWQLNEINALVWPSPEGIGIMNQDTYQQTADIAVDLDVVKQPPDEDAYRTDLAEAALDGIEEDANGADYQKEEVEVTAGGE